MIHRLILGPFYIWSNFPDFSARGSCVYSIFEITVFENDETPGRKEKVRGT